MKCLKVIFVEDIDDKLSYNIHIIEKLDNGYYKLNYCNPEIKNKSKQYFLNNPNKYCYIITLENYILENIYEDKVTKFIQVLENLYKPENKISKKLKIKKRN